MSQAEHSDPERDPGVHDNETHTPVRTPSASVTHIPRLRDAMNDARQSHADRMDSIMGVRAAEVTRLEILKDALKGVIEEASAHWDAMHFDIVPGDPPRFWIDMLGYVAMGRDARTYRLIEDLRSGRRVLFESADVTEMAARITEYVAHRLWSVSARSRKRAFCAAEMETRQMPGPRAGICLRLSCLAR